MKYLICNREITKTKALEWMRLIKNRNKINTLLTSKELKFAIEYWSTFRKDYVLNGYLNNLLAVKRVVEPKYKAQGRRGLQGVYSNNKKRILSIKNTKLSDRDKFIKGVRHSIEDVVYDFKKTSFKNGAKVKCKLTGVDVNFYNSHVDHYDYDFIIVVKKFINLHKITSFQGLTKSIKNGGYQITDKNIVKLFIEFHNKNTNLRITTAEANLKRKKAK